MPTLERPQRLRRSVAAGPHDTEIISGYTNEMLDNGIAELSAVPNRGPWENERLAVLTKEKKRREAPALRAPRRPLDLPPCKD